MPLQECLFSDESAASNNNPPPPMWLGEREYQALRIVSGQPAFGASVSFPVATVLEWELSPLVDFEKGCYLGQERVAAQAGNPLPQSLYQIEFLEEENNDFASLQRWPTVNDTVYVLGSNEELIAGKIVEMAEPASQGTPAMLGLIMVKRANSLLRRMKQLELDLPCPQTNDDSFVESSSGTRDKLDGLEVIVNGELIGRVKTLPFKLLGQQRFLIDDMEQAPDEAVVELEKLEAVAAPQQTQQLNCSDSMPSPTAKVDSQAEQERKEAKMELLRKRAEEALARRQQKKSSAA
jgi:folate-binding protein YgfZ